MSQYLRHLRTTSPRYIGRNVEKKRVTDFVTLSFVAFKLGTTRRVHSLPFAANLNPTEAHPGRLRETAR